LDLVSPTPINIQDAISSPSATLCLAAPAPRKPFDLFSIPGTLKGYWNFEDTPGMNFFICGVL
jgi:hypothetical protein